MDLRNALSEREVAVLARRVAIRQLRNAENWLLWEDLPELGEYEFERVEEAVAAFADQLARRLAEIEQSWDIDSAYLYELATESGSQSK